MIQYDTSPIINQLLTNFSQYLDVSGAIDEFYNVIWNINTAQGVGLDIWAIIVAAPSRYVQIDTNPHVGFERVDPVPAIGEWTPFNDTGSFYTAIANTTSFRLADDAYRLLVLTKAFANISPCDCRSLNQLLQLMFPNRGNAYVKDLGGMVMQYYFTFNLLPWEKTVLLNGGVLPTPAGVLSTVVAP